MDYEKAYKEALGRAKEMCSMPTDKATMEYIFPELRESEDERMMREFNDWLCEEIECRTNDLRDEKDRRTLNMLCYILTKVKDWLEKQQESLPVQETCKENADSFTSEDERILTWLITRLKTNYNFKGNYWAGKAIEYLEKQKEIPMPSSTELIDMWDKEEAMLKEKDFRGDTWRIAYNAFLDGFAQGMMVKQKEQKKDNPLEDFSKGYNAGYYHGRTDNEQKPELVPHPITYMYPSDARRDERLKMALLALLNSDSIKVAGNKFTKQDLIDWVEKQKEQKPDTEQQVTKEQLHDLNEAIKGLRMDGCERIADSLHSLYDILTKAQKPAWSEEAYDYHWVGLIQHLRDYQKMIDRSSNNLAYESVEDYIEWIKSLRPLPKQEWSEKDECILKGIIGKIDHDQTYGVSKKDMLSFLESLRPSWKPSEEQLGALKNARYMMGQSGDYYDTTAILDSLIYDLTKL